MYPAQKANLFWIRLQKPVKIEPDTVDTRIGVFQPLGKKAKALGHVGRVSLHNPLGDFATGYFR